VNEMGFREKCANRKSSRILGAIFLSLGSCNICWMSCIECEEAKGS
jgi:hypothetical protein